MHAGKRGGGGCLQVVQVVGGHHGLALLFYGGARLLRLLRRRHSTGGHVPQPCHQAGVLQPCTSTTAPLLLLPRPPPPVLKHLRAIRCTAFLNLTCRKTRVYGPHCRLSIRVPLPGTQLQWRATTGPREGLDAKSLMAVEAFPSKGRQQVAEPHLRSLGLSAARGCPGAAARKRAAGAPGNPALAAPPPRTPGAPCPSHSLESYGTASSPLSDHQAPGA